MEIIVGLPDYLREVPAGPPGPLQPGDPDADMYKQAWESWASDIKIYRLQLLADIKRFPQLEIIEWRRCKNDPAYFVTMYGYLFEPRRNGGRGGYSEWIPFERQVQMIRWWQSCMAATDENADGIVEKCRDVGASWLMCALFVWGWLFETPFNTLMVSWKEPFVDSKNPKALFWKIDKIIQYLPTFLTPPGFNQTQHRNKLYLENPANGNVIGGETTTSNSGRGDRVTAVLFDEAAQIPDFMDVWMGTTDSTEHRFAVSTPSMAKGPDFSELVRSEDAEYRPSTFFIDWFQHPLHDQAWFERQEKRYAGDPDAFRQEVLRDPYTNTQFVYPTMRDKVAIDGLEYVPGNPLFVCIDPGFDDDCALVWIQHNLAENRYEVLNGYSNDRQIADFYGPMLSGSRFGVKQRDSQGKEFRKEIIDTNGISIDGDWAYGEREMDLMLWVESVGGAKAKFIGDMYGDHRNGASADTWYSVWAREHGIAVNRDRLPNNQVAAHRMRARTLDGRRKALRWILPKLVFADTVGARQVLHALQNNSFGKPSSSGRINESGMFRDKTTHFTSAVEYWAANLHMQHELYTGYDAREQRKRDREDRRWDRGGQNSTRFGKFSRREVA